MPNTKWDGAEEPTINNSYKIKPKILYMLLKVRIDLSQPQYFISTEVYRTTPGRQVGYKWSTSKNPRQVGKN